VVRREAFRSTLAPLDHHGRLHQGRVQVEVVQLVQVAAEAVGVGVDQWDAAAVRGRAVLAVTIRGSGYPMDTGVEEVSDDPALPSGLGVVQDVSHGKRAEAALRETVEETGLEVELVRVIGCYGGPLFRFAYPNGHLCEYVATVFEARPRRGAVRPDGEETSEVGWFGAEAAAGLTVAAHTRFLIVEAFRRDPGTRF